ncbi:hypothetical protein SEVIR_4G101400v4 [Setaria viridis]|uniref:Uncharacterized protein n=1 Tax=Setaria viridis TaxID=4556 RepID=A0A4U6UZ02_SETVI|nr:hypothetical protein SEVIR_4G101400v2 [Setaria viridis]
MISHLGINLEHTCVLVMVDPIRSQDRPQLHAGQVPTSPPVRQLELSAESWSKGNEPNWCVHRRRDRQPPSSAPASPHSPLNFSKIRSLGLQAWLNH